MSQCTPTAIAKEPERERAHSSWSTALMRTSAPAPPYFSSYSTPRKPSSPMRGQIDFGMRPAASHSSTWGATSLSTKLRTAARNISCCSLNTFTGGSPFRRGRAPRRASRVCDDHGPFTMARGTRRRSALQRHLRGSGGSAVCWVGMVEVLVDFFWRVGHWSYLLPFVATMLESAAFLGLLVPGE